MRNIGTFIRFLGSTLRAAPRTRSEATSFLNLDSTELRLHNHQASTAAMADPFEVRMRFTSQLQHLNASTTSATKAANYALKYADYADDLHSCILEQLERNNMNNRANIMYFLPALCDTAKAASQSVG